MSEPACGRSRSRRASGRPCGCRRGCPGRAAGLVRLLDLRCFPVRHAPDRSPDDLDGAALGDAVVGPQRAPGSTVADRIAPPHGGVRHGPPAVTRLSALLGAPSSQGDVVDRDELARTTGLRLPADCRDFVTLYGGGELDEYLGVSMPPVAGSPYGGLVDGLDFDPREEPVALVGTNPEDVEKGGFFPSRGAPTSTWSSGSATPGTRTAGTSLPGGRSFAWLKRSRPSPVTPSLYC